MLRIIKQHYKALLVVLFVLAFCYYISYKGLQSGKHREKTTFTAQETKILWSELGLEYIDLDISKASFNDSLYVTSEGFDSIDAEIEYLKQFKGNENVHKADTLDTDHKGNDVHGIFDIKYNTNIDFRNEYILCTTYEENGKYYLEFYKKDAGRDKDYNLYEMFGFNDE